MTEVVVCLAFNSKKAHLVVLSIEIYAFVEVNEATMSASSLAAEAVWKDIESTRSDDQLSILHFLFGKNFERATRIVDQRGVKRISGEPSGRFVFQVMGESQRKEEYFCFAENYCACYSFFYDIVNRGEQLCCKHQLAARLALSLGVFIEVKVSDEQLAVLLSKL
ncbi:zinc finger SWIM domain-containing protein 7 isoform X2 [Carya illinoinensis]|uniref:zinc finger SWIM domain-containing protein 7 isoform X2 n=2 Tax=Carya illinoinensis TaxID=32201 RepID=UPI001C721A8E|nr:zinc finger SWIM domain-containing protein 7 isoform X2 [Carya illinoinensis]